MTTTLHCWLRRASYALLPVDCAICGTALWDDAVPFFCSRCWTDIRPLSGPCCPRCGRPFQSAHALAYSPWHHCHTCRVARPSYTRAWSLYRYASPLDEAIKLFKYRNKVTLAPTLGALLHQGFSVDVPIDLVMAVPLHPGRLREREYNHALLLASALARRRRWPLSYDNLVRTRETPPQTALTRRARIKNLRRAFAIRRPAEVAGRCVLLIDDVFTTGTTVNECAKALRRAGSGDVYVVTLARTI